METKIYCHNPACQQKLVVDESYFGRAFTCPVCGMVLQIPVPTRPLPPKKSAAEAFQQAATPISLLGRVFRLLTGWGLGAVLFALLFWIPRVYRLHARLSLPIQLDGIIQEVSAPANLLNLPPVSNNKENLLLYARSEGRGVGLFLADLTTSERRQIEHLPAASIPPQFIGWSPDDRYLAVATTGKKGQANEHILIHDGASGAAVDSFDLPDSLERGEWLSTNSLILSADRKLFLFNFGPDLQNLGPYGRAGLVQLRFEAPVIPASLKPIRGRAVAYDDGTNLWYLSIATAYRAQLTHLTNVTIGELDYSPENGSFLFSLSVAAKHADPCLYRFDPRTNSATAGLAQFTDRYNFERINYGSWIAQGTGLAYAGQNFLGVTIKEGSFHTNLFANGYYRNFNVSPRGDKIFALASVANEPPGIWSYDINYGDLDQVVPPKEHLEFSQWVEPNRFELGRTKDHGRLDYSVLVPPYSSEKKKCPAVLNLFGTNPYDDWPQFLANAGIVSVSIPSQSPNDIKAILKDLLKKTNVDPRQVFIIGQGPGSTLINQLLEENPKLWRGAILIRPAGFPQFLARLPDMPGILVFGGVTRDLVYALKAERFMQTACRRLVPAQLLFDEDLDHALPKSNLNQERCKIMAEYVLTGQLPQLAEK